MDSSHEPLIFVKLGGSVISDKTAPETARRDRIVQLAAEVAGVLRKRPNLRLILSHGSGSFGHVVAQRYGTRQGVRDRAGWVGFAQVAAAAARLNRLVTEELLTAGVPVWSLQPSASARCRDGRLVALETWPLEQALVHGLVPLVYGDVALDEERGGTIVSTEEILAYLARRLRPAALVLVGAVDGVFEGDPLREPGARRVPEITPTTWPRIHALLGGSHGTDVTGGMLAKVEAMVALVQEQPGLVVHLISGERPGALRTALLRPTEHVGGTIIRWE